MRFWMLLLIVWLTSLFCFRFGAIGWWRLTVKYRGHPAPTWGDAISASWYAASGCFMTQLILGRW